MTHRAASDELVGPGRFTDTSEREKERQNHTAEVIGGQSRRVLWGAPRDRPGAPHGAICPSPGHQQLPKHSAGRGVAADDGVLPPQQGDAAPPSPGACLFPVTPVMEKAHPHKPRWQRSHINVSTLYGHLPPPDGHADLGAPSSSSSGAKRGIPGDWRGCIGAATASHCCLRGCSPIPSSPRWMASARHCHMPHLCSVPSLPRGHHPPMPPLADPAPPPAAKHGSPLDAEVRRWLPGSISSPQSLHWWVSPA